jgi:hypothetical protein
MKQLIIATLVALILGNEVVSLLVLVAWSFYGLGKLGHEMDLNLR